MSSTGKISLSEVVEQERALNNPDEPLKVQISTLARLLYIDAYGTINAPENAARVLGMMHRDNETTLPLFTRLLTTGTDTARDITSTVIRSMISEVIHAQIRRSPHDVVVSDEDNGSWFPYSHVQVLRAWNTMNVLEEAGEPSDDGEVIHQVAVLQDYYDALNPAANGFPSSDEYWRGVAAVAAAVVEPMTNSDLPDYIAWAGSHPDIKRAMDVAYERNTFNVDTLVAVIEVQDLNAPVLREGTL